jgi:predicted RNA binding protein YcfA (HicA-like mRNA interferase family)
MSASELPKASGRKHVKAFLSASWVRRRQFRIAHRPIKPGIRAIISIPDHTEVSIGTLRQIVRAAGLTDEEYRRIFDRS